MPIPLLIGIAAAAVGAKTIKGQVEKAKTAAAIIEEKEAKCAEEALAHRASQKGTDLQIKMLKLLLKHAHDFSEKLSNPPISSDWKHLAKDVETRGTKKYSVLSWNEYAFCTNKAIYYHDKKKGIHEVLYYDNINAFDIASGIVDYGNNHQQRDISHWQSFEKRFVEQISHLWKMSDETDTSVLEFCFNNCSDFRKDLRYLNTGVDTFLKQPQGKNDRLREYWSHLKINSMSGGKIKLQFWGYFPQVERVFFSENDSEEETRRKELRQEELEWEAEMREREVYRLHDNVMGLSDDIAAALQQAIYRAFGVLYQKENITITEEPDYTYEGPSKIDRINDAAESFMGFVNDYADKHDLRK